MQNNQTLKEFRCECGKLLFKAAELLGIIEIKCKRCGQVRMLSIIKETSTVISADDQQVVA